MNLAWSRGEDGAVKRDDAVKRLPDSGEFEGKVYRSVRVRHYFWAITPGTYHTIFQRLPSSIGLPAASPSLPAVSFMGPVKICFPAMIAVRSAITLSARSLGTAGPQQAISVPPSLMPGNAPYGLGSQLPAAIFLSSGERNLSHVQTEEHSVAFGAHSRKSRWWPVP